MMTTSKSRGYAYGMVKLIQAADQSLPAVKLGQLCVERDIPVRDVANALGVARMTVYHWFTGRFRPRQAYEQKIIKLLEDLQA
jgi:DNA-binding transcriptional regulator YiaG